MRFEVLDTLQLSDQGPITNFDERLREQNRLIAFRQGALDGACGPYSLMTALMIMGVIRSREDVYHLWESAVVDKRTSWSRELAGAPRGTVGAPMFQGTTSKDLTILLDAAQKTLKTPNEERARAQHIEGRNEQVIQNVIRHLAEKRTPVILGIELPGGSGHWVTAIGYQSAGDANGGGEPTSAHLLLIDPAEEPPKIAAWNAVISTTRTPNSKYPFCYWGKGGGQSTGCRISDSIALEL